MKSIYLMRFTAKCRTIINLGFFSLVWITSLYAMTFDQTRLYNNATQFGNKTSNLYELANIVVQLNAHKPNRFVVPAFLGISHADISSYLSHVGVIQFIDEQWSKLPAAQPLNTTVLTQETKKILAQIRRSIIDAFDKYPFQITDQARMKTLENFLQKAADAKQLLMVRSTGREDSKKFANAGGNESIAAVSPDIQPVSKAIGEVVASYFSEKSMEQRLIGEPEKLLDSPFMPVLLQVMVGELPWERDTQIPVSGVIFSEEAEGTTPGVTNIQATYGHNEGVVNGLIPVDTFYIGPSKIIHPLIQIKDERLKAVGIEKLKKGTKSLKKNGIGKLERVTNPVTIQKTPCLDKSILEDLKYCADFIEKYYGYAVDIEFVVLNNVINLVQARPLTYKSISPSYLNENFVALPTIEKISVTTIGAGGGQVRTIKEYLKDDFLKLPVQPAIKQAVIIADTMRQAFDIFRKIENKAEIQAIIVGEMSPATSHDATNFRGAGKPVVKVDNPNLIRTLLETKKTLLLDTQREIIAVFESSAQFPTLEATIVLNAWLTHPISKKTSLFAEFWAKLPEGISENLRPQEFMKGIKTSKVLDFIRNAPSKDIVEKSLRSLLNRINATIVRMQREEIDKPLRVQLQHLFLQTLTCAYEIYQNMPAWFASLKTTKDRLIWLYPITFLDAIIKQIPQPRKFVHDYSFVSLLKIEQEEKKIKEQLGILGPRIIQYAKAGRYALTDEIKEKWEQYLLTLPYVNKTLREDFAKIFYNLTQLDLLPIWLNLIFSQTVQQFQPTSQNEITKALVEEYNQVALFFNEIQSIEKRLDKIVVTNWEKPEAFEKMWMSFEKDILQYFLSNEFIKTYEKAPQLAKFGFIMLMNQLINTFDISIKTLKASSQYKTEPKLHVSRFKMMLQRYLALLEYWVSIPSIAQQVESLVDAQTFKTLAAYLSEILKSLSAAPEDLGQFQPSAGFNVAAAALGSKTLWTRSVGGLHLEDIFTLIHQNLLVVLSQLTMQTDIVHMQVPHLVEILNSELQKLNIQAGPIQTKASLIGISFSDNKLTYYYNIPIRNHSSTAQVTYDLNKRRTIFSINFLGPDGNRWPFIIALSKLMATLNNITFAKEPVLDIDRGLISFAWYVDTKQQAELVARYVPIFIDVSVWAYRGSYLTYIAQVTDPGKLKKVEDQLINLVTQLPIEIITPRLVGEIILLRENISDLSMQKLLERMFSNSEERTNYLIQILESLNLVLTKVTKNNILDVAISAKDLNLKFKLLGFLVGSGYTPAYHPVYKTIKTYLENPSTEIKRLGISLLIDLLKKRYRPAYQPAYETAKTYLENPSTEIKRLGISLLIDLLKERYGPAYKSALKAASEGINSQDREIQFLSLIIFVFYLKAYPNINVATALQKGIEEKLLKGDLIETFINTYIPKELDFIANPLGHVRPETYFSLNILFLSLGYSSLLIYTQDNRDYTQQQFAAVIFNLYKKIHNFLKGLKENVNAASIMDRNTSNITYLINIIFPKLSKDQKLELLNMALDKFALFIDNRFIDLVCCLHIFEDVLLDKSVSLNSSQATNIAHAVVKILERGRIRVYIPEIMQAMQERGFKEAYQKIKDWTIEAGW